MMKKIRYTRSRLRENMLLVVAMIVRFSLWKVWYACISYALQGEPRHGCIGKEGCYGCLGTEHPLAPGCGE